MTTRVVVVRAGTRKVVVRKSGQSGVTPTLEMGTVTTLAAGEAATAVLTALDGNVFRLDLGLPAGQAGEDAGFITGVSAPLAVDEDGVLTVDLSGVEVDLSDYATLVALGVVSDAVDAMQVDVDGLTADLGTLTTTVDGKASQADLDDLTADLTALAAAAPNAHAATHAAAGSDPLTLTQAQITGLVAALAAKLATTDMPASVGALSLTDFPAGLARDAEVTSAIGDEATARDAAIATAVSGLLGGAPPTALDTLDELAAALADDANFAATVTTLLAGKQPLNANLTAIALLSTTTFGRSVLELTNAAGLRSLAGLVLGTDIYSKSAVDAGFQPLDSDLTTVAALDSSTAGALVTDGAGWIRKTYAQLKTALALVKADVGLGSVDNTADTAKPVSTAQQTALDLKANLASPTFTGTVAAPTPTAADSTTKVATTAFVQGELAAKAPLASPTFTGDPKAPTATVGDNDTSIATTAFVQTASGLLVPKSLVDAKGDLLVGSANDTVARLAVGTDAFVLTADAASTNGVKWAAAAAAALLASVSYNPGTAATLSTTSRFDVGGYVDVDATNAAITFTVPASGAVLIKAAAYVQNTSAGHSMFFALRESTTTLTATGEGVWALPQTGRAHAEWKITGLTPGASLTYKLAYATGGVSQTCFVIAGGGNSNPNGPLILEAWAA